MPELPTGTLTLLFSDIEGSTKLLDDLGPEQYAIALKRHRSLMRRAFADNGGTEVDTQGDAFFCVFRRAADALQAAADLQRAHAAEEWPPGSELRVRVGLHTGDAIRAGAGYVGTALHRAARVMSAGHGAQVLLSQPTADLAQDELPEGLAVRDLGEHRLKDLSQSQHLYQLLADGLPSTFPPLKTLENRPTNLPQQPNRLIGREKELEQIIDRLRGRDTRLLTLVGPGGTGKTRLALQACAEVVDDFADGVFFVSLAPLRDATLVYANIAATLGVREQGGQTLDEALAEYLRRKDLLLLLDNFEQVVEAAPQLAPLLDSSTVSLLVTSREPLRVAAERVHSVPPLSTPERNGPIAASDALAHSAVRLFVERARAVREEFELTDEVASDVAAICWQLDGMPLAVELAAARTNVLSPSALRQRLGKTLDTLSAGGRDVDERQRTLRGAIAWSYDLLPTDEQILFERLCVFVGGCRLEAAEEVCVGGVDVLTGLSSLAEKSLLRIRDDDDGERRFWMFETIREYALERLEARGEAAELRRRHLRYWAELASRAGAELAGPEAGAWLVVLEREINNIRIALGDAAHLNERDLGIGMIIEPYRFWIAHGRLGEARRALADMLADPEGLSDALAGRANSIAADFALWQNDYGQAAELAQAAVPLFEAAGLADRIPGALITLGWAMDAEGEHEQAATVVEQALPLARESGDLTTAAGALNTLAHFREVQGDYVQALEFYNECLELLAALDDRLNLGVVLGNVGGAALGAGDSQRAIETFEQSLELARELGDNRQVNWSQAYLALARLLQGELEESHELFLEVLPLISAADDSRSLGVCLLGLAATTAASGDAERAARLWGAALKVRTASDREPEWPPWLEVEERYLTATRESLGERFVTVQAEGESVSTDELMQLVGPRA